MKITDQVVDDIVLGELGARIARARLEGNLTQAQLAIKAGISKPAVQRSSSISFGCLAHWGWWNASNC